MGYCSTNRKKIAGTSFRGLIDRQKRNPGVEILFSLPTHFTKFIRNHNKFLRKIFLCLRFDCLHISIHSITRPSFISFFLHNIINPCDRTGYRSCSIAISANRMTLRIASSKLSDSKNATIACVHRPLASLIKLISCPYRI